VCYIERGGEIDDVGEDGCENADYGVFAFVSLLLQIMYVISDGCNHYIFEWVINMLQFRPYNK